MTRFNLSNGVLLLPKQFQRGICPRFNYSNGSWHCGCDHLGTNAAGMGSIPDNYLNSRETWGAIAAIAAIGMPEMGPSLQRGLCEPPLRLRPSSLAVRAPRWSAVRLLHRGSQQHRWIYRDQETGGEPCVLFPILQNFFGTTWPQSHFNYKSYNLTTLS
jgi:hypothetical protein